jgi:surfeit locus 1 family protein
VLGAVFFVIFMGLGIWQVERLQWKLDLIERVDARVHAERSQRPEKMTGPTSTRRMTSTVM